MNQLKCVQKSKVAFYNVFKTNDSFGKMFDNCINQKIILCLTDGCHLKRDQFDALMKTIKMLDESSFYISITEADSFSEIFDNKDEYICKHWKFDSEISYEEYKKVPIVLENALYSTNGTWGIIISHEDHAVLGGADNFIKLFKKSYKNWNKGLKNFVEMWKNNKKQFNSDLTWLPDFLNYINQS